MMKYFTLGIRQVLSLAVFAAVSLGAAAILAAPKPNTNAAAPADYEDQAVQAITCEVSLASAPDAASNGLVQTSSDALGLVAVLPDNTIQIIPQVGDHLYQVPEHLRGPDTKLQVQGCGTIINIPLPTAVATAVPTAAATQKPPTGGGGGGGSDDTDTCDLWLAEVENAAEEGLIMAHPDAEGVVAVLADGSEQAIPLLRDNIYQVPEELRNADVRFKVVGCDTLFSADQLGLLD